MTTTDGQYAVVTFLDDATGGDEPEFSEVPSCWLTSDLKRCWWPKTRDIAQYISKNIAPYENNSKWNLYNVTFEGFYKNLKIARQKAEYLSCSSSDEVADRSSYKRSTNRNTDYMNSIPEADVDSGQEPPKIPNPPKLPVKKNEIIKKPSKKTTINSELDYIENQLTDLKNGNVSPLKLTPRTNANPSISTDDGTMNINDNRMNSLRYINKTSEKQKPTILQDITFLKSSPGPPASRVLYTEPAISRDIGNDPSLGSISFPPGDDLLVDIIGNQHADQLTALGVMIKEYFSQMSNSFIELTTSVRSIESRLTEIERAVNMNATTRGNANQFSDIAVVFPFATEFDAMKFEADMKSDDDRRRVVTYLAQVGGNCAKECIKRILSKAFSVDLANVASWQGQLGNFKVGDLKIMGIIKDAVRVSYACTDKFFEDEGKEWFRQGTQKFKRALKKTAGNNAANAAVVQNNAPQ